MSPDPFDDIDRALASGLSRLAPEVDGADETLAAVRPRFERARTRSRIVKAGATLAALLAVGTVATIAAPSGGKSHVSVNSPSATPTTSLSHRPTTTRGSSTTVPGAKGKASTSTTIAPAPGSTSPGQPSGPANPNGSTSPTTAPVAPPATTPSSSGGPGPSSGGGHGKGPGGPSTTTTTVPARDGTHVYRSDGGSITVRVFQGALRLLSNSPARGYHAQVHTASDNIDVRFVSSHGTWRIRVRIDDQGHLTHQIDHS